MRKSSIIVIFLLIFSFSVSFTFSVPLDFIVMVDTSNSMENYFDDLVQYIISDIIKKNLHPGDTFHLIRFSEYPVHELTQVITDGESTDAILKKISFLKSKLLFGKYTDILTALKYLILYAEGLPKRNNKKLLLLSDFIHNPPAQSPYADISLDELEKELVKQAKIIRERDGWSIHFIRFPAGRDIKNKDGTEYATNDSDDSSKDSINENLNKDNKEPQTDNKDSTKSDDLNKEKDVKDIISDTFGVEIPTFDEDNKDDPALNKSGFPRLEFPGYLGRKGRTFTVPFKIHNDLDEDIVIELNTLEYSNKNILAKPVPSKYIEARTQKNYKVKIKLPPTIQKGSNKLPVTLTFKDDYRIAPREGILSFYYTGDTLVSFSEWIGENFTLIITILIIIIIVLTVFIFIRMRVFEGIFSDILTTSDWGKPGSAGILEGENLIEMRVLFQNPHIGFRNIHKIEDSKSLSIGGGFSTYLIFLIPMPAHIAEITNIDGTYMFTPLKMEFFPDLKGPMENCLNKEIPVVSKHGYRTQITFIEYESPLSRINKLLHSVQHEGD